MQKINLAAKAIAKNIRLRMSAKKIDGDTYELLNTPWYKDFFRAKYYLCGDENLYYGHPLFVFSYAVLNEHYKLWLEEKKEGEFYKIKSNIIWEHFIGHCFKIALSDALIQSNLNWRKDKTLYIGAIDFLDVFKSIEAQLLKEENYELLAALRDETQAYQEFEAKKKKVEK